MLASTLGAAIEGLARNCEEGRSPACGRLIVEQSEVGDGDQSTRPRPPGECGEGRPEGCDPESQVRLIVHPSCDLYLVI
jgi:hypothetical protein